jgi:hypothetical protein
MVIPSTLPSYCYYYSCKIIKKNTAERSKLTNSVERTDDFYWVPADDVRIAPPVPTCQAQLTKGPRRRRRQRRLKSNTRAMSAKFSQWTPGVATTIAITAVGDVIWESIPRDCKAHGNIASSARFHPTHSTLLFNILYRTFRNCIVFTLVKSVPANSFYRISCNCLINKLIKFVPY